MRIIAGMVVGSIGACLLLYLIAIAGDGERLLGLLPYVGIAGGIVGVLVSVVLGAVDEDRARLDRAYVSQAPVGPPEERTGAEPDASFWQRVDAWSNGEGEAKAVKPATSAEHPFALFADEHCVAAVDRRLDAPPEVKVWPLSAVASVNVRNGYVSATNTYELMLFVELRESGTQEAARLGDIADTHADWSSAVEAWITRDMNATIESYIT